ncbi:MAG: ethanolamine utilization microcompartment protein EutL [Leptospiraceae bacterium]|nr:ethanolamine utilization microcompartment protein EutL [Leptospiraceae bacterium]MCB1199950.1 ethanolamine utilization microcompartment protein EutL [Leptospiraceae bacterium]
MILKPIRPRILSLQKIPNAHEALLIGYGANPEKHTSLALITVDQDDSTYVALDEATKHANVDVVFAKSFYAGSAHSSGKLSGEILGVLAGRDPDEVEEGIKATIRCLEEDACFYSANEDATITFFPHVISSVGYYLAAQTGLQPGESLAYLVAPPIEATMGFDAAAKGSNAAFVKIFPPPTETNFAAAWLTGDLNSCETAAEIFAETIIEVARNPKVYMNMRDSI